MLIAVAAKLCVAKFVLVTHFEKEIKNFAGLNLTKTIIRFK